MFIILFSSHITQLNSWQKCIMISPKETTFFLKKRDVYLDKVFCLIPNNVSMFLPMLQ